MAPGRAHARPEDRSGRPARPRALRPRARHVPDHALRRRRRGRPALGRLALGGVIAWWLAQSHPDLVTAALLEDPPLLAGETPETEAGRFRDVFHAVRAVTLEGRERGLSEEEL